MKYPNITIVAYDHTWPEFYIKESQQLKKALGDSIATTHHIGSTAIINMPAKPVIDIIVELADLRDFENLSQPLSDLGYSVTPNIIPHFSRFARREAGEIAYHLHIFAQGDPQVRRHVNFRDYMNAHPANAKDYAELKQQLAQKYFDDREAYTMAKNKFVQETDHKAKQWPERRNNFLLPNLDIPASEWSQNEIVHSMNANLSVHMTHFSQYLQGAILVRKPAYTLVDSGLTDDTFNYILRANFADDSAVESIVEINNYFSQQQRDYSWWVGPGDKPDNLMKLLTGEGYINSENNTAMYFDLDQWAGDVVIPPELNIIKAEDKKSLRDFALVLANDEKSFEQYFSMIADVYTDDDPIEYYVGYVNDKPVVRGLICYFANVAGLHWLSTAIDERHQGYGKAMQQYRLKRAKDRGYHIAVLQASDEGYPLYKKLGYQECGVYQEFKLLAEY